MLGLWTPQSRKRTVLIASLHGKITLPEGQSDKMTVRDAIGKLPEIYAGNKDKTDPLHVSARLSELNLRRIIASKTRRFMARLAERNYC